MSYSDSFPTQRPSLNLVFNGGSDQLDSRISFSRADSTPSAVHYWSNEKHLSSENLVRYSNDLSNGDWTKARVTVESTNNAAPDGSTTASNLLETTDNSTHTFFEDYTSVVGVSYTHVWYAKANGRSKFVVYAQGSSCIYDLTAVTATTTGMDAVSIEAVGSTGYYKCVASETATTTSGRIQFEFDNGSGQSYAGDASKGLFFWGFNISSTGQTVTDSVAGSIHREYSSTLKSVASSGQPRFEYDPTDGQSEGLLIESQATNLTKYSDDFSSWGGLSAVAVTSNAGVAPSGQLAADLLVSPSTAAAHYILDSTIAFTSGTTYTASVYVKSAGHRYVQICGNTSAFGASPYQWVNYDLEAGTLSANNCSGTITAVGNGYYRITATMTATVTSTQSFIMMFADSLSSGFFPTTTGDDYSGFLAFGFQTEVGSSASSLISTSGAAATKSADSCSVATSSFYTGGPVSVISELAGGSGYYPQAFELRDTVSKAGGVNDYILALKYSAAASGSVNWQTWISESGNLTQTTISASSTATTLGVSVDSNSVASCADGGTIYNATSTVIPDSLDTLYIGRGYATTISLNGHIKRLALYNVALSDTELQALTS